MAKKAFHLTANVKLVKCTSWEYKLSAISPEMRIEWSSEYYNYEFAKAGVEDTCEYQIILKTRIE